MMKSKIDTDIYFDENHVAYIGPKEYPNWYGIPEIGFIWFNSQSDPYIEYDGFQMDSYIIEDTMWDRFREDKASYTTEEFEDYMRNHIEEIIELIEFARGEQ